MERTQFPIHERLVSGTLLAMAAGGLDSYSYLLHGNVFAGLQTGNLILLGTNIGSGHFGELWHYIFAILMFMIGAVIVRHLQSFYSNETKLSRQAVVVMYEIALLAVVLVVGRYVPDVLASGILSLAAAAQLQEFRKLKGGPFTSLMMTGNLRTVSEGVYDFIVKHDSKALKKSADMGSIILSFVLGALVMGFLVSLINVFAIAFSMVPLIIFLIRLR
ncbi:YoaK family protein [Pediococcus argentinicus]|uniref:YoaK family protein n=1 Tax=Pediococcus argentinicus TaxID=480391 RepID=UPI0033902854